MLSSQKDESVLPNLSTSQLSPSDASRRFSLHPIVWFPWNDGGAEGLGQSRNPRPAPVFCRECRASVPPGRHNPATTGASIRLYVTAMQDAQPDDPLLRTA